MLNDEQVAYFRKLYDFVHDERHNCANMRMLIDLLFPDPDESEVSRALHSFVAVYLEGRMNVGAKAMELLYALDERITKEGVSDDEKEHIQERPKTPGDHKTLPRKVDRALRLLRGRAGD